MSQGIYVRPTLTQKINFGSNEDLTRGIPAESTYFSMWSKVMVRLGTLCFRKFFYFSEGTLFVNSPKEGQAAKNEQVVLKGI